jgi:NAD(P)H-dependent flavin oxidoreductase YrpB (nitropropane dioxygenase family)
MANVINGRIISNAYQEGDVDGVMIGCGQCVGLIHETKSVKEVIENMMQEAQSILQKLNAMKE